MRRTLLIGHHGASWRDWLKEHRGGRPFLCLDPADPVQGVPGQICLFKGAKPSITRFYGSLDPQRAPHVTISLISAALATSPDDLLVQFFPYRSTPLLRQVSLLVAQMLQPTEILIAAGTDMDQGGFPVGPSEVEIEKAFPPVVQMAQRKALWIRLFESCQKHTIDLRRVSIDGARLGTGQRFTPDERKQARLEHALYAERAAGTLFVVSDVETEEGDVSAALDFSGCSKAHFVTPGAYRNLLCGFARQSGEDFGIGIVTEIDWQSMRAQALCTAIPPAPLRILRLGALRVDSSGRELGEVRPWQV
ncbi:MAG: hypothetical protein P4L46_24290 [Fimbriimonas sp.]|nr:hypothetical protein [Fimbriimonas sp.]